MEWMNKRHYVPFDSVFDDVTAGNSKVKKLDYLAKGILPIVDQGQNLIAGYTNNERLAFKGDPPVVVFGDHTCAFKYVDFPFAFGADGVRVLHPHKGLDARFAYYYLLSSPVSTTGYSRHFKYLKEKTFPLPPISEQRRIVELLDQADTLRKKRAEADKLADRILPALFYKMFGDPATFGGQGCLRDIVTKTDTRDPRKVPNQYFQYVDIAGVSGDQGAIETVKRIRGADAPSRARKIIQTNDVLVSSVRPYLRATALVPPQLDNQICTTGFCVLRPSNEYGYGFIYAYSRLQWFADALMGVAKGASYPAVSDADIYRLPIPELNKECMVRFDNMVSCLLDEQQKRKKSTDHISELFETLLHRAFTGDLTSKWREAHMKELLQEMEQQARFWR